MSQCVGGFKNLQKNVIHNCTGEPHLDDITKLLRH